ATRGSTRSRRSTGSRSNSGCAATGRGLEPILTPANASFEPTLSFLLQEDVGTGVFDSGGCGNRRIADLRAAMRADNIKRASYAAEGEHPRAPCQDQLRAMGIADRPEEPFKCRLADAQPTRRDRERVCQQTQ